MSKVIQIEVSPAIDKKLETLAKAEKRSKKSMVEWIVENFLLIKEDAKK